MKNIWKSFCIACSMYSRIPVPQVEWDESGMKYALCFFPLIGVITGGCVCVISFVSVQVCSFGPVAYACLGTAVPLLINGGIHLDGFLDTVDALSSFQTRERKLEIMKDPHCGAFAVIACGVYLLLYTAAFSELGKAAFPAVGAVYVMCRALSGWAVVSFPKAKKDGLATTFSMQAEHRCVRWCMAVWLIAGAVWLSVFAGILVGGAVLFGQVLMMVWYYHLACKEFGGVTGDLAGFFLQSCEWLSLAVMAVLC